MSRASSESAPNAAETRSLTIHDLPDDLLRRVMAATGRMARPSLLLASKRWQRCCYSEPSLWNPYSLPPSVEHRTPRYDQFSNSDQPRWHDGNLSLLRRVHHLVTDLRVQALTFRADIPVAWVEQLSVAAMHSLAQLRPGGVKALTLCWPALPLSAAAVKAMPHCAAGPTWLELSACQVPAETAGAVRQLTSLSALRLVGWGDDMVHGPGPALPPGVVRILPRLSRLRELHISFPAEAGILAEVLPRLPRLRSLACRVYAAEPLMASVSALSALIQLELVFTASASLPDLRPLTQLQCLEALTLTEHYADHLDSGYVCPPPSAFPRLSMFNIDGFLPDAIHLPAADCKLSCCRFNWVEGPNAGAPENQQPSNRLELRLPAAVQDEAPSVSVHRLLSALAGSLPPLAVSELQYGGPPQLVQQLLVCSQLRGVSRLTLHAPGTVSLQNVSLPALRALACGWQSFADSTSLSLQSVQLPALTRLAYDGSGGSLRMDGCTLPQLAQLEPTRLAQDSGDKTLTASISIAACALLALQQLSLSTRQLCLTGVQLPALTALRLTTGQWAAYSVGRELLIDGGSLPVLQTLEASGFSNVSLQTELPSLTSLELRALPDSSTAESAQGALPALRSVVLAGERCVLLAHTPAVLAWLAGLPPLHRLVLKHLRLPDNLPDGPWLSALEQLEIDGGEMPCLPAAIRGTTQLKSLRCSAMGWKLQRADVDDVLQPLTQLLELDIPWMQCCDPPVFLHLFNTLRQLPPPAMWRQ